MEGRYRAPDKSFQWVTCQGWAVKSLNHSGVAVVPRHQLHHRSEPVLLIEGKSISQDVCSADQINILFKKGF